MSRLSADDRLRLERFKAVKVKHPRLEEVDQFVAQAIDEHAGHTHLLLYGPSGVGKSTVTRRIAERFSSDEPNRAVVPVVWVEARPSDTGVYARLDYYRQVLMALREYASVKDRLIDLVLSPKPARQSRTSTDWLEMREGVEYALERLQVKAVVIDEAQHLMQVSSHHRPADQLDWLKSMTNYTNTLHILVGPYDLFDFRNLNGQAARRGRDVHFPRYHVEQKEERREFIGSVQYLLEQVPLQCNIDELLTHWNELAISSIGCIGIFRDWLVDTVAGLMAIGEISLTMEALNRYALKPEQRWRLETDARRGEQKVQRHLLESQQQWQQLLQTVKETPRGDMLTQSTHTGRAVQISRQRTKIERAPQRDPVGSEVEETLVAKCSFIGVIPLSPEQITDSGIAKVECPECATMRTLKSQGKIIRFPSHPKRKTNKRSTETRWIRIGNEWKLTQT